MFFKLDFMAHVPCYFFPERRRYFKKETNITRKQKTMRLVYPACEYNNNYLTFQK